MSNSRVYVGNLPSRATERDLEHFFRGFGRIRDIMLKNGFGFVEFEDQRDADDAVYEQNGRDMMGSRIIVEMSRRKPDRFGGGSGGGYGRDSYGGGRSGGSMSRDGRVNGRYPPPHQTRYRMLVTNLSTRFSWQDLKDMMRAAGEVTYADAHKRVRNEAIVCFGSHDDLRRAIDKFQGKEINGRRIKLVDETEGGGSRRRSRSRSPRSRSRSPRSRSRSRSARRSRSRSPPSRSPSHSKSRSKSPVKNGGGDENGNKGGGGKRSRTRSGSSRSSSRSRGRGDNDDRAGSPKMKDEEDDRAMDDRDE